MYTIRRFGFRGAALRKLAAATVTASALSAVSFMPSRSTAQGVALSDLRALSARPKDGVTSDARFQAVAPIALDRDRQWNLLLNTDVRVRAENRRNFDNDSRKGDDDVVGFVRTRVSADVTHGRRVRFFFEGLDGRQPGADVDYLQESSLGPHQAFVELADPDRHDWSVRTGFQELVLGRDRRYFNATQLNNLRRTFVGVRSMKRSADWDVDFFALQPRTFDRTVHGTATTGRETDVDGQFLGGVFATYKGLGETRVEVFAATLRDRDRTRRANRDEAGNPGTTARHTVGLEIQAPITTTSVGRWVATGGGGVQWGQRSDDAIRAWEAHGSLGHEWRGGWKPRVALDAGAASGDAQTGDGETETFSNLFGRNFNLYGRSGQTRFQNLILAGPSARIEPTDKLRITSQFYGYWLQQPGDAWSDTRNTRLASDASGRSGRDIGHELNMVATYRATKWCELEGGAVLFRPGGFAKKAAGRVDDTGLVFLQSHFTF